MARTTVASSSLLAILILTGTGWAAPPRPVAVSPGEAGAFSRVGQGCPTFSWGGVEGAVAYELVVFAVDRAVLEESQLSEPRTAQLQVTLPGVASSWTPSMDQCLKAGERYAWFVRALGTGVEEWSQAKVFAVAARPSIAEVEEALALLRRYIGEEQAASTAGETPSDVERASKRADRPGESDGRERPSGQATDLSAANPALDRQTNEARAPAPTLGTASLTVDQQLHLGAVSNVFKEGEVLLWDDGFNTALGRRALAVNDTGDFNTALGAHALRSNTTGIRNTAIGYNALYANTSGRTNTAIGMNALVHNIGGYENTAVGYRALSANLSGMENVAIGPHALFHNFDGDRNIAIGYRALFNNQGTDNIAVGRAALDSNTTGDDNIAIGRVALSSNTTGNANTAIGSYALRRSTGSGNVAIGGSAGTFSETGNNNIFIDNYGRADDTDTIRIGSGSHDRTFIGGIRGTTTGYANAVAVVVDVLGQLGTVSSSRRYKEEIRDMAEASDDLLELRPVTFRFKPEVAGEDRPLQFGLIAEEVAEIYPELVAYGEDGQPEAVLDRFLSSMLLNQAQKQHARITAQAAQLAAQERELGELRARLASLEAREVELTTQIRRLAEPRRKRATPEPTPARPEAPLPVPTLSASERRREVAEACQ